MTNLCDLKYEAEKTRREVVELMQRVLFGKPPTTMDSMDTDLTSDTSSDQIRKIQQQKLDAMAELLRLAEIKYYQTNTRFVTEWNKIQVDRQSWMNDNTITSSLLTILERRMTNITDKLRDIHHYTINYYLRSPYGVQKDIKERIEFGPSLIIDGHHSLTYEQRRLFSFS